MVHCHTVHLPLGALLSPYAPCVSQVPNGVYDVEIVFYDVHGELTMSGCALQGTPLADFWLGN